MRLELGAPRFAQPGPARLDSAQLGSLVTPIDEWKSERRLLSDSRDVTIKLALVSS